MSAPDTPKPAAPFGLVIAFYVMFNANLRNLLGAYAGYVLNPLVGFGDKYPVLTIMITGSLLVVLSTIVRHFTTDWVENARMQAYNKHYRQEMMKAQKEKNLYRIKQLEEYKPTMMAMSQKAQSAQLKTMPLTMLVVIPLFAWMGLYISRLDYTWFSTPWNPAVTMFGTNGIVPPWNTSVFPHYILLYIALSIPLGSLIQKGMKYASWKERWQKRHPGVTE